MPTAPTPSKTATSTPRLSEYAKAFTFPSGIVRTVWPRVEAKGLSLGLGFDWWQSQLGSVCLGYGEDGKYVATVGGIGMSIPRQVGKTYFVLAMLVVLCILYPGLQVVWTAHHLSTSTKTFTSLRGICQRKLVRPHLAPGRKGLRSANGEQQAVFRNGSKIMFGSRKMGFGRGFDEIDIEVFDEGQILDTKSLEDMVAATNQARHEHGALLFFMGTPPRSTDPSEAFRQRRDEALEGETEDAVWLEIAADPESDPNDEDQWAVMNPSYPLRTPRESLLRLRKNLKDDDSWNREGRGIWDPKNDSVVIDEASWGLIADPGSMAIERLTLAIDVPPDRSVAAVALAGRRADGLWHVELDEQRKGVDWVIPWVAQVAEQNRLHAVVVDELAGLTEKRRDRNYLIGTDIEVTLAAAEGRDMAIACAKFFDAVMDRSVRHTDQPQSNVALSVARKRPIRAGGWAWNRKDGASDITPIVAETLALWGAQNDNVKRPTRRQTSSRTAVIL
ncbi:terminase [Curtobacterium sp. VKM Ac-2884]|uniref:terminase n=1 Tax=Curtobacterium sp. VKM Ac-2884 TaxID=2783818 RepID=UPI00188B62B7|nr:terminase [Curtobacterium sp. VKM Ac-2884]MBF4602824.1 terminase [Curtobacterium sp. VKM Ac-2884]